MVKIIGFNFILFFLIFIGLNSPLVQGAPRKKHPPTLIAQIGSVNVNDQKETSKPFFKIGYEHSNKQDDCFWTKHDIYKKDCFKGLPDWSADIVATTKKLEDDECKKEDANFFKNPELACKCIENRVENHDSNNDLERNLIKIKNVEQDTLRRSELDENINKIFIREYIFNIENFRSCNANNRFKKLITFNRPLTESNSTLPEKSKFCSSSRDLVQDMKLFKKVDNNEIPRLKFEDTIKAGLDLVRLGLPKGDEILKNYLTLKKSDPNKYMEIVKKLEIDVRAIIGEYFKAEDELNSVDRLKKNKCNTESSKLVESYTHLCNFLNKYTTVEINNETKGYLKIALEVITENPEAIRESIDALIQASAGKIGDSRETSIRQTIDQKVNDLKKSFIDGHQNFCDNTLGDKDAQNDIDSIKKYCFDDAIKEEPTLENSKKFIESLEQLPSQNSQQKKLKDHAIYKYCSYIRIKFAEVKEIMGRKESHSSGSHLWIKKFIKENHISQACLNSENAAQQNRLSTSILEGNGPKPMMEMQKYLSEKRPNLFSKTPTNYKNQKSFSNDVIKSNSTTDVDGNSVLTPKSDNTHTVAENNQNLPGARRIYSSLDEKNNNMIVPAPFSNRLKDAAGKGVTGVSEEDTGPKNSAVEAYRKLDPSKQMNVIKDSNNPEMLEELLREVLRAKSKETEDQRELVKALKEQIKELREGDKRNSGSHNVSPSIVAHSPLKEGFTPLNSRTKSPINRQPPVYQLPLGQPNTFANKQPEIALKASSSAGSTQPDTGTLGESSNNSQKTNNRDVLRILKKDLKSPNLADLGLDPAKVTEKGDNIEIELVECPDDIRIEGKDEKCVKMKEHDKYVLQSHYKEMIETQNEKNLVSQDQVNQRKPDKKTEPLLKKPFSTEELKKIIR